MCINGNYKPTLCLFWYNSYVDWGENILIKTKLKTFFETYSTCTTEEEPFGFSLLHTSTQPKLEAVTDQLGLVSR